MRDKHYNNVWFSLGRVLLLSLLLACMMVGCSPDVTEEPPEQTDDVTTEPKEEATPMYNRNLASAG